MSRSRGCSHIQPWPKNKHVQAWPMPPYFIGRLPMLDGCINFWFPGSGNCAGSFSLCWTDVLSRDESHAKLLSQSTQAVAECADSHLAFPHRPPNFLSMPGLSAPSLLLLCSCIPLLSLFLHDEFSERIEVGMVCYVSLSVFPTLLREPSSQNTSGIYIWNFVRTWCRKRLHTRACIPRTATRASVK